ncbi:hypothetical protein [Thiolapillus sp.]
MKAIANTILAASCMAAATTVSAAAPEPLRGTYADIGSQREFKLGWQGFKGMELDEADDLEGWTASAELVFPFMDKFQLRLSYPFRTDAEAVVKDDQPMQQGETIDVEGYGGVFDFLTVTFEHQLMFAEDAGYNLSYYVGGGRVPDRLDTTKKDLKNPEEMDPFNHTGMVFLGGVKFDRVHGFGQLIANLGLRYYTDSDDLHPAGDDSFPALDAKVGAIFSPWGMVHPAVELTYLGDFSDLNQFSLVPQVLVPYKDFTFKAGAEIGLGGNGNELGAVLQASFRF